MAAHINKGKNLSPRLFTANSSTLKYERVNHAWYSQRPVTLQSKLRICGTAELCVCGAFIYLLSIPALCVPVLTLWCPDPKRGARMYCALVRFYIWFCCVCFLI